MVKRWLAVLLFIIPILGLVCLAGAVFFLWSTDYETIVKVALRLAQRPDLEHLIRTQFFTEAKFSFTKNTSLLFTLFYCAGTFYLYKQRTSFYEQTSNLLDCISAFLSKVKIHAQSFNHHQKWPLVVLFSFLLFRSIFYATHWDIQFDEAWNYNYFLSHSFLNSIIAYNNYPLHNLITWPFVQLFGSSVFVLRIPVMLMGLICIYTLMLGIKIYFKEERLALLMGLLFACLPVCSYYMLRARGVLFEVFFALIVFVCLLHFLKTKFTYRRVIFLSLLNGLGTYCMLSHVYFIAFSCLGLAFLWMLNRKLELKFILLYSVGSIVLSGLFLLPMYLGTGLSLGISAAHSNESIQLKTIVSNWKTYSLFFTSYSLALPILISFIFMYAITKIKEHTHQALLLLSLIILIGIVCIPLLTGIFPPARAIAFAIVPLLFSIAMIIQSFQLNFSKVSFFGLSLLMMLGLSLLFHKSKLLNWSKESDFKTKELATILQANSIQKIFNTSESFHYFVPGLTYYYKIKHMPFEYVTSIKQGSRYTSTFPDDSPCIVIDQSNLSQYTKLGYEVIFSYDTFVVVLPKNELVRR